MVWVHRRERSERTGRPVERMDPVPTTTITTAITTTTATTDGGAVRWIDLPALDDDERSTDRGDPTRSRRTGQRPGAVADGDARSIAALFVADYEPLVRLAFVILGDAGAAEEVVQDSFAKVQERWSVIDDPQRYLRRVVVNGCRDRIRRAQRLRARMALIEAGTDLVSHRTDLGERRDLVEALRTLPPRQCVAIVLRFYGDLSQAQIAEAMGVREGTVKSLLNRGTTTLRAVLEPTHGPGGPDRTHDGEHDGTEPRR